MLSVNFSYFSSLIHIICIPFNLKGTHPVLQLLQVPEVQFILLPSDWKSRPLQNHWASAPHVIHLFHIKSSSLSSRGLFLRPLAPLNHLVLLLSESLIDWMVVY